MKFSFMSIAAVLAALSHPINAMNPEDVKGVLSDTIVSTPDLCQSLCTNNPACFYSLYHLKCDECWQMDCSAGDLVFFGTTDYTKFTTESIYYCNQTLVPEMPGDSCTNLTATATITSSSQATGTGTRKTNSTVQGKMISWIRLGAMVATSMVFVA